MDEPVIAAVLAFPFIFYFSLYSAPSSGINQRFAVKKYFIIVIIITCYYMLLSRLKFRYYLLKGGGSSYLGYHCSN